MRILITIVGALLLMAQGNGDEGLDCCGECSGARSSSAGRQGGCGADRPGDRRGRHVALRHRLKAPRPSLCQAGRANKIEPADGLWTSRLREPWRPSNKREYLFQFRRTEYASGYQNSRIRCIRRYSVGVIIMRFLVAVMSVVALLALQSTTMAHSSHPILVAGVMLSDG